MNQAWIGALATIVGALMLYLGNRYIARSTRVVGEQQIENDRRKVDQEAFDRFIDRYEHDRQRQEDELDEQRTVVESTRRLLREALKHINLLRGEMRRRSPDQPVPALPEALETVPWDMLGDGDPRL